MTWLLQLAHCFNFPTQALDRTEPVVVVGVHTIPSFRSVRLEALVDTGAARSLFRFEELAPLGFRPDGDSESAQTFTAAGGSTIKAFELGLKLELASIAPFPMDICATEHPLSDNILGRDFLLRFISAFDFKERRLFLGEIDDRDTVVIRTP